MIIVKKIARFILRSELAEMRRTNTSLLCQIEEQYNEKVELNKRIKMLEEKVFGSRKVLLSQTMVKCIVEMLPDPNRVGCVGLTSSELKSRSLNFIDEVGGRQYQHFVRFVQVLGDDKEIRGLAINISEYNINVLIPLRRENLSYEIFGIQTAIDTYFWDFYGAGIRMLSDEAFALSSEFIKAQLNILS